VRRVAELGSSGRFGAPHDIRRQMNMKTLTLSFLCLTLTTAFAWAADYHLVQTFIVDSVVPAGVIADKAGLTVYVLVPPDKSSRAVVFKTFDSKTIEARLSDLPRGSMVHYEPDPRGPQVPSAQLEALKTCCAKKGIGLSVSNTN
jgi:hypothetical protein